MNHTSRTGRLRRILTSSGITATLVLGTLSVAAVTAPSVAGATTNPVAASWSSGPTCGTYATATPPAANTLRATVTVTTDRTRAPSAGSRLS